MKYCLWVFTIFIVVLSVKCSKESPSPLVTAEEIAGSVKLTVAFEDTTGAHQQDNLVIHFFTDGLPEIFDTIAVSSLQDFSRTYSRLAANHLWYVDVKETDWNDSVVEYGSSSFEVDSAQVSETYIELHPRFNKLRATVYPGQDYLTRCELSVLNVTGARFKSDASGQDLIPIKADYIPLKDRYKIKVSVYGMLDSREILMYSADTLINMPLEGDQEVLLLLPYVLSTWPPGGPKYISALIEPGTVSTPYHRVDHPLYFAPTGHYYDAITTSNKLLWADAVKKAKALKYKGLQGHLATVTSEEENQFIYRYLAVQSGVSSLWIGGFRTADNGDTVGTWQWINGEPWNYTYWHVGEPNNTNNNENELMMWYHSGRWNDGHEALSGYIVEYDSLPTSVLGE